MVVTFVRVIWVTGVEDGVVETCARAEEPDVGRVVLLRPAWLGRTLPDIAATDVVVLICLARWGNAFVVCT